MKVNWRQKLVHILTACVVAAGVVFLQTFEIEGAKVFDQSSYWPLILAAIALAIKELEAWARRHGDS